jgi:hypothetical protein
MKDRLLDYGVLVGEEHQQGRGDIFNTPWRISYWIMVFLLVKNTNKGGGFLTHHEG